MRSASPIGWGIAVFAAMSIACLAPASGQGGSPGNSYYYVANTPPPDAFLDLRTHPSSAGLRIMTMPNGTLLEALERRTDGWWYVRVIPSGEEGWALSGRGSGLWIECCKAGLNDPVTTQR